RLRDQIVRGKLREGDVLAPEGELMQRFGVSRPTLREAMRVLEGEALITVHRGARGGARVHTPDGETVAQFAGLVLQFRGATVADVYEARQALDLAALRIIVGRGSPWDFVALDENVAAMGRATEPGHIVELHDEFHTLLVELAGNQTLVVFEQMIHRIIGRHGRFQVVRRDRLEVRANAVGGARTHARLLELLRNGGDPDEAVEMWRRHLDELARMVLLGDDQETVLQLLD
ncbi:MAG TPA: FCD domain-containing protein, partial [Acidimicrobiia bacterium]|nr:FCD domain-containing protein [Acidimicrobiia bacterium]